MCLLILFLIISSLHSVLQFLYVPTNNGNIERKPVFQWIGVLRVKSLITRDAVTGIILIANHAAIANADDVARLDEHDIRNTTVAILFSRNFPWKCNVEGYILHPEYNSDTNKNTVALVKLDSKRKYIWNPISWPSTPYAGPRNIYAVGFTDQRKRLEQFTHRMFAVNNTRCVKFYMREGLGLEKFWPKYYRCFEGSPNMETCVYDAGVALATNSSGRWTLMGMSTYGPGCSLPSRFIEFFPYVPWITSKIEEMRFGSSATTPPVFWQNARRDFSEPYDDEDNFIINKVSDDTISLKPTQPGETEVVDGNCTTIDGRLIYAEEGHLNIGKNEAGTAVFSVSLYDLSTTETTCVKITLNCTKKSSIKMFWRKGFHQDDISSHIKLIPIKGRQTPKPPKMLYIKDDYVQTRRYNTVNIWFKFEFLGRADLKVWFYGKLVTTTTTDNPNATTIKPTRATRKYVTHLRPPPPKS